MSRVAILGTGLLGAGFAENLIGRGADVVVYNRTARKTEPLVALGASAASSPAEAVQGADRAHLVLTADDAVDAVLDAAREGLGPDTWVFDHSTNAPARVAERFPRERAAGVRYVPAPVFMSPNDARNATGLMLLAATDAEAKLVTPLLEGMTGKVWHVGERPELAAVFKLCGNGALVTVAGLMGDLYAIGEAQGLQSEQVDELFDVFRIGAIFPRVGRRVRGATEAEASFELSMARKDVALMIEAGGAENLVVLPGVAAAMDASIEKGNAQRDFAIMAWPNREH